MANMKIKYKQYVKDCAEDENFEIENLENYEEWENGEIDPEDQKMYKVTSICKDDIIEAYRDSKDESVPSEVQDKVDTLSNDDMKFIATRLADNFCNCCYWDSLKAIFEVLEVKE